MTVSQNVTKYDAMNRLVSVGFYKALIVMTNSSIGAAGQEDVITVDGFTTLDEMNGANYVRKDLAGIAVVQDDLNDRAELTFTPITWTLLGAGTRNMKGVLIYEDPDDTDDDSQNIPRWFLTGGFPQAGPGADFVWGTDVKIYLP